jgi:hypothetical protein
VGIEVGARVGGYLMKNSSVAAIIEGLQSVLPYPTGILKSIAMTLFLIELILGRLVAIRRRIEELLRKRGSLSLEESKQLLLHLAEVRIGLRLMRGAITRRDSISFFSQWSYITKECRETEKMIFERAEEWKALPKEVEERITNELSKAELLQLEIVCSHVAMANMMQLGRIKASILKRYPELRDYWRAREEYIERTVKARRL